MPTLFGRRMTRKQFYQLCGSVEQVGGLRRIVLDDGLSRGVEAIELRTGAGLEMLILAGRGLDILNATLHGRSFAYIAPIHAAHPAYADDEDLNFLRTFSVGFLTTCGLYNVGAPGEDHGEKLGLHGRYPMLPACEVNAAGRWQGNDYVMTIEGTIYEYALYGTHYRLTRRIEAKLGENAVTVEDEVENMADRKMPHQILYHFNLGWPLLGEGAETLLKSKRTIARETGKEADEKDYRVFPKINGAPQDCAFFHEPAADSSGMARVAVVNRQADAGRGLALDMRFTRKTLPWLVQWRNPRAAEFIQGIEPANAWPQDRYSERQAGRLQFMKPGEVRKYRIELGFLSGPENIKRIKI